MRKTREEKQSSKLEELHFESFRQWLPIQAVTADLHAREEKARQDEKWNETNSHYTYAQPYPEFPNDLWRIVAAYAFSTARMTCPINHKSLQDPVVFNHPNIGTLIYSRESVMEAVRNGELISFDITLNNINDYLVPVQLPVELIEEKISATTITDLKEEIPNSLAVAIRSDASEAPDEKNLTNKGPNLFRFLSNLHLNINLVREVQNAVSANDPEALQLALTTPAPLTIRGLRKIDWRASLASLGSLWGTSAASSPFLLTTPSPYNALSPALWNIFKANYFASSLLIDYQSTSFCIRLAQSPNALRRIIRTTPAVLSTFAARTYYNYLIVSYAFITPSKAVNGLLGAFLSLFFIPRTLACTDLALTEYASRQSQISKKEKLVRALLTTSILVGIGLNIQTYVQRGYSLTTIALPLLFLSLGDAPSYYLAIRQTASAMTHPRSALRHTRCLPSIYTSVTTVRMDADNSESRLTFVIRNLMRVAAVIFMGLLFFKTNPGYAVLDAITVFIINGLLPLLWKANSPYQLRSLPDESNAPSFSIEDDNDDQDGHAIPLLDSRSFR